MYNLSCDDIVLALQAAPVDPRTGNKVLYGASWTADRNSMIGQRNEDWVRRELDWFASGSNNLADMEEPVPALFKACADEDGVVNSAYGHILYSKTNNPDLPLSTERQSLYEQAISALLTEGEASRHATIIVSDRDIHRISTANGRNDFICTNALNLMIDADDRLHIFAQMRSMDAVFGYRADYSMWDYLMKQAMNDLLLGGIIVNRGDIVFQVANLHVYPRHLELLAKEADIVSDRMDREARRIWAARYGQARG